MAENGFGTELEKGFSEMIINALASPARMFLSTD